MPYLSKSGFILKVMIHSLILVLSPAYKNKEQIIKKSFFPLYQLILLQALKWPGSPTSLGPERQLREALFIFTCQFLKEISHPFILIAYFLP